MSLRSAVATVSLGRSSAGHTLLHKLEQAASHSFEGIELFYECLEHLAQTLPGGLNEDNLFLAAKNTRQECDRLGLEVICLQPFMYSEGLTSEDAHKKVILKLQLWFRLAKMLRTDIIQIPTNFLQNGTTGDLERITADLLEFAQLGMQESPVIKFAYEGVAWGTHIDTWEGTWEVVKRVNMPNFGLCLDTFHIAARVWGDPTANSGKRERGDQDLADSLAKMAQELDVEKIFYLQAGDAEKLASPLTAGSTLYNPDQPERMIWSRNARLFPFETEKGAYLPVTTILDVILHLKGYRGWVSLETFSTELYLQDASVPAQYAQRAQRSWDSMARVYG
ncbi:xylose isomerase-like protein [Thozetella sp. PMI_491]|nr:xylose isomerase-like protein [Thozetella sp. PMI_491]